MLTDWRDVEAGILAATGDAFRVGSASPVGGGCINEAVCLEGGSRRFFVKLNAAHRLAMFEAEAEGLDAILTTRTVRAPRPVAWGISADAAWLALEYIELHTPGERSDAALGSRLAAMHGVAQSTFGWHRDNSIGTTAQPNTPGDDWVAFLRERRLGFQLALARDNGAPPSLLDKGELLLEGLDIFFSDYRPAPSLLHGDLWSGNRAADAAGVPVVFDPAVYCGDREADIAMTGLFGGFGPAFYAAYAAAMPLDPGHATRRDLYDLYHLLNHFNLFGGGYAGQALDRVERLLAAMK